jgi:general secretion pathway protein A
MRLALAAQRNCGCTTNCGYKCVHVSDPHAKHWLADDSNFLASLNDLDQGLNDGGRGSDEVADAAAAPPAPPAASPATLTPPRSAAARAARPINAARALDLSRVLDTASPRPLTAPPSAAVAPAAPSVPPPAAPPFADTDTVPDIGQAPPPLAPARPLTGEPRTRRPLLDLFPPSALERQGPPLPAFGTAVGPQLGRPPRRAQPVARPEPDAPSPLAALTYETFYGLREKPFSLSTDPRFQYQSASHERAGLEISAAVRKRGGPALLTAPLGMGKTTLCRGLLLEFDRRTVTSLVLEPMRSLDDLVTTLLVDFGVMSRDEVAGAAHVSRETLIATLDTFLESLVPLQASAVVLIDEAQNLPRALLGDLAAWLGGSAAGVVQLVLVGEPALTALLQHADLRGLNASVARRTELGPLAADEISGYVMHRLSIAGAHTRIVFDEAAIARLFALSGGSPRSVNLLCDRALTRGQAVSAGVIDEALLEAAASDLDFEPSATERPGLLRSMLLVAAFALLVLVGAVGALWMSRDAVSRTIQQWQNVPLPPGGPIRRLPVPIAPIPPPGDPREISDLRF